MAERLAVTNTHEQCRCWQVGRCVIDCPSAFRTDAPTPLSWWDRRANEWTTEADAIVRDIERSEARED